MSKILRVTLIAALSVGGFVPAILAQPQTIDSRVDTVVQAEMQRQKIPGLALAVMRNGKIIKAKGYGLSNIELNVPVTPESIFQSGSVGKQFTATAVMMLVEEGRLGLDERIIDYFPGSPKRWDKITVRHLLTHTSGITDYTRKDFDYHRDYTEADLLKILQTLPFDFAPGDKYSYSNSGYMLLGFLIHRVTGKFYGDFLQERIFCPLGMTTARIISEQDIIPHRSAGYELVKGELKNQEWVSPSLNTTADGSLYFSVLDLAKWDAALYTEKLLKQSRLEEMWTPVRLNDGKTRPYGFGWRIAEMNGHRLVEHGGAWQGFSTGLSRYLDDRLTIVALTNLDSRHSRPMEIIHKVAGLYEPALTLPPPPPAIEDKEPKVTAFFRDLLRRAGEGKAEAAAFTEEARKAWFPDRIKEIQEELEDLGLPGTIDLLERKDESGLRNYRYRLTFDDGRMVTVTLKLSRENKVAELDWDE